MSRCTRDMDSVIKQVDLAASDAGLQRVVNPGIYLPARNRRAVDSMYKQLQDTLRQDVNHKDLVKGVREKMHGVLNVTRISLESLLARLYADPSRYFVSQDKCVVQLFVVHSILAGVVIKEAPVYSSRRDVLVFHRDAFCLYPLSSADVYNSAKVQFAYDPKRDETCHWCKQDLQQDEDVGVNIFICQNCVIKYHEYCLAGRTGCPVCSHLVEFHSSFLVYEDERLVINLASKDVMLRDALRLSPKVPPKVVPHKGQILCAMMDDVVKDRIVSDLSTTSMDECLKKYASVAEDSRCWKKTHADEVKNLYKECKRAEAMLAKEYKKSCDWCGRRAPQLQKHNKLFCQSKCAQGYSSHQTYMTEVRQVTSRLREGRKQVVGNDSTPFDNAECVFCLEHIGQEESTRPCKTSGLHVFHSECWSVHVEVCQVKSKALFCPTCMADV